MDSLSGQNPLITLRANCSKLPRFWVRTQGLARAGPCLRERDNDPLAHAVLAKRYERADAEAFAFADCTAHDAPALHGRADDEAVRLAHRRADDPAERPAVIATECVALFRANPRALATSFGRADSSALVVTITHADAPSFGTAIRDSVGAAIRSPFSSADADHTANADRAPDTANAEAVGLANFTRAK